MILSRSSRGPGFGKNLTQKMGKNSSVQIILTLIRYELAQCNFRVTSHEAIT